jgi:hypothetical protein
MKLVGIAQESNFKIDSFSELADKYKTEGLYYLAYVNYLNYYMLSSDFTKRENALLEALKICVTYEQFDDAEKVMNLVSIDAEINEEMFIYFYSYLLLQKNQFSKSDIYLRNVSDSLKSTYDYYFLKSYLKLMQNQSRESIELLSQINTSTYDYGDQVITILNAYKNEKVIRRIKPLISVPLSMILPGSGQAYAGFQYDAIKNFGYNILFGYTSYTSWKHEFELPINERNYFFPLTSSVIFGFFYIVNIYNTINVTQKANLFYKNRFYNEVAQNFQVVLNDNTFQARICIKLN